MNLLDTSIVIDNLAKDNYNPAIISPITLMEVLRGFEDKKRLLMEQLLTESFSILNIDRGTIEAYCKIYCKLKQEGNLLPDADLIIAATAIAHDLVLETDDNHFLRLKQFGLKLK
jgi:Predicted nucleic acid-binding protein, contains PIN domain